MRIPNSRRIAAIVALMIASLPAGAFAQGSFTRLQILLPREFPASGREWTLTFTDKGGTVVRPFGGPCQPAHLLWDGRDENGLPLADGIYDYALVVYDTAGRELVSPARTVEIATEGPQGRGPLIPLEAGKERTSW